MEKWLTQVEARKVMAEVLGRTPCKATFNRFKAAGLPSHKHPGGAREFYLRSEVLAFLMRYARQKAS